MGLVLALDTSGPRCAAAIVLDGRLLAERAETVGRGHAERLLPLAAAALDAAGRTPRDLAIVAACVGPGGFTGPRIAAAAARGLALALDRPAVGVDRFVAAALSRNECGAFLFTLPAPQSRLYARRWRNGAPLGEAALLDADDRSLKPEPEERRIDLDADAPLDLAALARAAESGLGVAPARPLYLRPPDARAAAPATPLLE